MGEVPNSMNKVDEPDEPDFEPEDIGCHCEGMESDWQWDGNQGVYICSGCGAIQ